MLIGWLLCIVRRCREVIFKIYFVVIGAIKYGCCAPVVEIIKKIYIYSSVTCLQSTTSLKIKTLSWGLHCVKNAKKRAFSDLLFPIYGQNRIRIFQYLGKFSDSVQIRKNTDVIRSIYGKMWIRESLYFGIMDTLYSCG